MAPVAARPGGRDCELFNDCVFRLLRVKAGVPDDFVNEGWCTDDLRDGGGKGGTLMAKVGQRYIVKELSRSDHSSLLQAAGSYVAHCATGATLLCPIYLHFRDSETGRYFFVMRNALGSGPLDALYDLKGCSDDKLLEEDGVAVKPVHKRIWNVGMWVTKRSWSQDRRTYHEGKRKARQWELELPQEHREFVMEAMLRDTQWLSKNGIMDYSLLVAVKELSPLDDPDDDSLGYRPFLYTAECGREFAVFISIIDFLQRWTTGKIVASCVKVLESDKATVPPDTYAKRFLANFEKRLRACSRRAAVYKAELKEALLEPVECATSAETASVQSLGVSFDDSATEDERLASGASSPNGWSAASTLRLLVTHADLFATE